MRRLPKEAPGGAQRACEIMRARRLCAFDPWPAIELGLRGFYRRPKLVSALGGKPTLAATVFKSVIGRQEPPSKPEMALWRVIAVHPIEPT